MTELAAAANAHFGLQWLTTVSREAQLRRLSTDTFGPLCLILSHSSSPDWRPANRAFEPWCSTTNHSFLLGTHQVSCRASSPCELEVKGHKLHKPVVQTRFTSSSLDISKGNKQNHDAVRQSMTSFVSKGISCVSVEVLWRRATFFQLRLNESHPRWSRTDVYKMIKKSKIKFQICPTCTRGRAGETLHRKPRSPSRYELSSVLVWGRGGRVTTATVHWQALDSIEWNDN